MLFSAFTNQYSCDLTQTIIFLYDSQRLINALKTYCSVLVHVSERIN